MSAVPDWGAARHRAMGEADLPDVLAIERGAHPFPWTMPVFRDCLAAGYRCRVWLRGAEVCGFGIMSVAAGEAHILNLCIQPEHQGQGHGRGLLAHLLELARTEGAGNVFLEVRPSNSTALGLYRTVGFCEVGLRRGYYPAASGREDALVMAMSFLPDAALPWSHTG